MLAEHLTGQRQLLATERELHIQLEKRALKDLRKHQAAAETTTTKLKNTYAPLEPLGSVTKGRDSKRLSFNLVFGASVGLGSRGSRGRDPIPLTPEILHFLDRLEPDKGMQAMMLTEHLTGQRQLPATEQKLHTQLEKRALKDIRKQQAAAEAASNRAGERAEMEAALHTDALLQQIAVTARNAALAAGATEEEANAAGTTSLDTARAAQHAPCRHKGTIRQIGKGAWRRQYKHNKINNSEGPARRPKQE